MVKILHEFIVKITREQDGLDVEHEVEESLEHIGDIIVEVRQ